MYAIFQLISDEIVRCALRSGSRLLSGAQMEEYSMLLEHTLLASGDVAESGVVYTGWPARRFKVERDSDTLIDVAISKLSAKLSV